MASSPLITFKAGRCEQTGRKVKPVKTPGYVYLYNEDDLLHFCWRPRNAPASEPETDLIMFPGDGTFTPLCKEPSTASSNSASMRSPTNGRIHVLSFSSSGQKHYFWMQSKTQHREGDLSWFSQRDQRVGQLVDSLLQGQEVDMEEEMEVLGSRNTDDEDGEDGEDGEGDDMDVDDDEGRRRGSHTGGAGDDATGGNPREEGEASREGGADGGRAPQDANTSAAVQDFLNSLSSSRQATNADKSYTTLPDLLPSTTTIPYLSTASPAEIDQLCSFLPPELFTAAAGSAPNPNTDQKRTILGRVLRSPQLTQSLASLTSALHEGGLPMIGEALGLKVKDGGHVHGGVMPLGGGRAVEGFVDGVKKTVQEERKEE